MTSAVPEPALDEADRYRVLAEHAGDVVTEIDVEGRIRWVSPSVRDLFGYDPAALLGRALPDFLHPDDRSRYERELTVVGEGGRGSITCRYRHADGHWVWVSTLAHPVVHDGEVTTIVATARDVSATMRAQEALEQSEARYRLLADNATDYLVHVDADGLIAWASPAACTLLGLSETEITGHRSGEWVHPDDVGAWREGVDRLADGAQTMRLRLRTPDRGFRWFSILARPVLDDEGRVVGRTSSFLDVSDLVESEQRFRLLAENSADVVLLSDTETDLLWVSPSSRRMLGWEPEELVGHRAAEYIHPDDLPTVLAAVQASAEHGHGVVLHYRWRTKDGGWRWVEAAGRPFDDDGTGRPGRVVRLRDIDAEVRARQALEASEHRYRLLAENSADVILLIDEQDQLRWVSPSSATTLGWEPGEMLGRPPEQFIHPDDIQQVYDAIADPARTVTLRYRWRTRDGGWRWVEAAAHPFTDDGSGHPGRVVRLRDVQAEVEARLELDRRARIDDLTGLVNRGEGLRRLEAMLSDPRRPGGGLAVAFCDLDHFKQVNDELGHQAGDVMLRAVADRIRGAVRESDTVLRFGGDEIVVLLPGVHSVEEAHGVTDKIVRALAAPIPGPHGHVLRTSLSIGVVMAEEGDTLDAVIARADRRMYEVKQNRREAPDGPGSITDDERVTDAPQAPDGGEA